MSVYVCNQCGFQVPAGDHVGVALMQAHLAEHDKRSPSERRAATADPTPHPDTDR